MRYHSDEDGVSIESRFDVKVSKNFEILILRLKYTKIVLIVDATY